MTARVQPGIWQRLAAEKIAGDALAARVAAPDVSERLFAAVDTQGRRHLLIELGERESELQDGKSRGIEITTRDLLLTDGTRGRYLDLACREPLGFDVFDLLGGDLATALAAQVEEPALAVQRLVQKWRRFWLAQPRPTMSRDEQIGLFAELWFLVYWLIPRVGAASAVNGWRGPLGARHDWELPGCAIEVKATTSATGRTHRIHGIDQLEPPEAGPLYVFSLLLREEGAGKNTLSSIVGRARDLASAEEDETIVHFEAKLAQTGFRAVAAEDDELRLRIVDERLYVVDDQFPRIIRASLLGGLPVGVADVAYSVDLSVCAGNIIASRPDQLGIPSEITGPARSK